MKSCPKVFSGLFWHQQFEVFEMSGWLLKWVSSGCLMIMGKQLKSSQETMTFPPKNNPMRYMDKLWNPNGSKCLRQIHIPAMVDVALLIVLINKTLWVDNMSTRRASIFKRICFMPEFSSSVQQVSGIVCLIASAVAYQAPG